jgi:hypothetical protein
MPCTKGMTVTILNDPCHIKIIGHLSFEIFQLSFAGVGNIKLKTKGPRPKTVLLNDK